uniref:non-specific serine/threonine protein kinase n=1 Tax=Leersia perrieri TaxID=77586 RepID=A0A0D9W2T3_9ORYZ
MATPVRMLLLLSLWFSASGTSVALVSNPGGVTGNGSDSDVAALLAFKSQLADPFGILSNWTTATSFCDWSGVSCSRRRPRVTSLVLYDVPLKGNISPHLGNLSFLSVLDLPNIGLTGTIPADLGRLRRLQFLVLARNSLSGVIPPTVFDLTQLKLFALGKNSLSVQIPRELQNLQNLRYIDLRVNYLTGPVPDYLFNNTAWIKHLYLANNSLSGAIPVAIGSLPLLKHLDMGYNNFSGPVPESIFNMSKFEIVSLESNWYLNGSIPGKIPQELAQLKKISGLYLDHNQFTGSIPTFVANFSQLTLFLIHANRFTGSVPTAIGSSGTIECFNIGANYLQGSLDFLATLSNCRKIWEVGFDFNYFTGTLPDYVGNFSSSLINFSEVGNKLSGLLPVTLSNLSNLVWLDLSENKLSGTIPGSIMLMDKLTILNLSGNSMFGSIPRQIGQLRNLHTLSLNDNNFSEALPKDLGNLTNLAYLVLSNNQISSAIPASLFHMDNLIILDLSQNSLEGAIPEDIGQLNHIDKIDLSANSLFGRIPDSLGQVQMTAYLNVSHNSLNGSFPSSFDKLINLISLDVSYNDLSGTIPQYLANFAYLSSLNLSFNNLHGPIPEGGIFSNITLKSLTGNPAFCGGVSRLGFMPCQSNNNNNKRHILKFLLPTVIIVVVVITTCLYMMMRKKSKQEDRILSPNRAEVLNNRLISYHDIVRATDNFSESNLLGAGSFGKVFKGQLSNGTMVAIKVLNMQLEQAARSFDSECHALRMARHRNLIKIDTTCSNMDFKALIFPYMPNGSLEMQQYSHDGEQLGCLQRLDIMLDVSMAMEYLHHHHSEVVLHCDLKPSNVLFDQDMVAYVADFAIAKLLCGNDNSVISASMPGTIGYMAPEYGSVGKASRKSDVFSYGIILLELFTGKRPTDPMFVGELSLRKWISRAFPSNVMDVVDNRLLLQDSSCSLHNFLVAVFELGLLCSHELPDQRMTMSDVVVRLTKMKKDYMACMARMQSP